MKTDSTILLFEGGDNVWDDPETYVKLLAVYRLKNAMTPMLLAVGDDDGYYFLGAVELCNSLRLTKKDVTLLRYAGRGHGFFGRGGEGLRDAGGRVLWQVFEGRNRREVAGHTDRYRPTNPSFCVTA